MSPSLLAQPNFPLKDTLASCYGIDTSQVEITEMYSYGYDSLLVTYTLGANLQDKQVGEWRIYVKNMLDTLKPDTAFRLQRRHIYNQKGILIASYFYNKRLGDYKRTLFQENENYIEQDYYNGILRREEHMAFGRGAYVYLYYSNGQLQSEGYKELRREYKGCLGLWPSYYPAGKWKHYNEDGSLKEVIEH